MLGRLFARSEERALTYQALWGSDHWGGEETWSGTAVSQATAMQMEAVYACIKLYADTISTLPAMSYIRIGGERKPYFPRPAWLDDPGVDGRTWVDYVATGIVSYFITGEWLTRIYRNTRGEAVALQVMNPADWEVYRDGNADIKYRWLRGSVILGRNDVLHMPDLLVPGGLRGISRIDELKQDLGLNKALTEFAARFFGNGSITTGIIETPAMVDPAQAREIKRGFEASHKSAGKAHGVGVLGGGAKWTKTGVDPEQAQMLGSRAAAVESVARIFRVPPHKLGVTTPGAMSYASVEQNNIAFAQDSLRPLIRKIEDAHSRLLPGGAFIRLNMDAVLRADTATRYSAYSQALQSGWASTNEVRKLEDLPAVEGGDVLRVPQSNIDLPSASIVETEKNVAMAVELINAGADPEATLKAFGLPAIAWTEPAASSPDPGSPQAMPMTDPNAGSAQ